MKNKKEQSIGRINLNLVNYKLLNGTSAITCNNSGDFYELLRIAFPGEYTNPEKVGEGNRTMIGTNGSTSYIFSGYKKTDISIPVKHENDIKEKLEAVGLTLEGRQCL
jgi:hypothetical protein